MNGTSSEVAAVAHSAAWVDPRAGKVTLGSNATAWVDEHPGHRPRTREEHARNLRLHILPTLGHHELGMLTPSVIRRWHSHPARSSDLAPSTVAKQYRTLHAVLAQAVRDELVVKNPCVVPNASKDQSAERPVATVAQVADLAAAAPDRWRAAVWLAAGCALRLSEILELRRRDVDLLRGEVGVERQLVESERAGEDRRASGDRRGASCCRRSACGRRRALSAPRRARRAGP